MKNILFEDYYLLVVNKAPGIAVESGPAAHPSVEREALFYITAQLNKRSTSNRLKATPYLRAVHRLDRPVGGVLVLAKTKTALTNLMYQFENHEAEKIYAAITPNLPPADSGTLVHFLKKDETGKKALVFDKEARGLKRCELDYTVVEKNWKGALLELRPKSGRFHQIRAQLSAIGCPVFGDEAYGARPWKEFQIKLFAKRLKIRHPKSGEEMVFEAPLPENW